MLDDRHDGFSLIELLVAVTIAVAIGGLLMRSFVAQAHIARDTMGLVELRDALRVARLDLERAMRVAGRGGLPRELAVSTVQNVAAGTKIGRYRIAPQTDVLVLRGSFEAPVWELRSATDSYENLGSMARVRLDDVTDDGRAQDLGVLEELAESPDGRPETEVALIVSGAAAPFYALATLTRVSFEDLDPGSGLANGAAQRATLELDFASVALPGSGDPTLADEDLAPQWRPSRLALLEEVRYYVRELPAANWGPSQRMLSRAEIVPTSGQVAPAGAGAGLDVAAGIFDLQVALEVEDLSVSAFPDGDGRRWRFADPAPEPAVEPPARLVAVRLSLVGRTARPTAKRLAKPIDWLENRFYDETGGQQQTSLSERRYRRRVERSLLRPRNS